MTELLTEYEMEILNEESSETGLWPDYETEIPESLEVTELSEVSE